MFRHEEETQTSLAVVGLLATAAAAAYALSRHANAAELRRFRDRLEVQLVDPASARYRNDKIVSRAKGGRAYCGYVNARNSFGGYVGFRAFVVTEQAVTLEPSRETKETVESLQEQLDFLNLLKDYCFTAADLAAAESEAK
jgi:hypothetical protein